MRLFDTSYLYLVSLRKAYVLLLVFVASISYAQVPFADVITPLGVEAKAVKLVDLVAVPSNIATSRYSAVSLVQASDRTFELVSFNLDGVEQRRVAVPIRNEATTRLLFMRNTLHVVQHGLRDEDLYVNVYRIANDFTVISNEEYVHPAPVNSNRGNAMTAFEDGYLAVFGSDENLELGIFLFNFLDGAWKHILSSGVTAPPFGFSDRLYFSNDTIVSRNRFDFPISQGFFGYSISSDSEFEFRRSDIQAPYEMTQDVSGQLFVYMPRPNSGFDTLVNLSTGQRSAYPMVDAESIPFVLTRNSEDVLVRIYENPLNPIQELYHVAFEGEQFPAFVGTTDAGLHETAKSFNARVIQQGASGDHIMLGSLNASRARINYFASTSRDFSSFELKSSDLRTGSHKSEYSVGITELESKGIYLARTIDRNANGWLKSFDSNTGALIDSVQVSRFAGSNSGFVPTSNDVKAPYFNPATEFIFLLDYAPATVSERYLIRKYSLDLELVESIPFEGARENSAYIDFPIRAYTFSISPLSTFTTLLVESRASSGSSLSFDIERYFIDIGDIFGPSTDIFVPPVNEGDPQIRRYRSMIFDGREFHVISYATDQSQGVQITELEAGTVIGRINLPRDSFQIELFVYGVEDSLHVITRRRNNNLVLNHYVVGDDVNRTVTRPSSMVLPVPAGIARRIELRNGIVSVSGYGAGAKTYLTAPDDQGEWRTWVYDLSFGTSSAFSAQSFSVSDGEAILKSSGSVTGLWTEVENKQFSAASLEEEYNIQPFVFVSQPGVSSVRDPNTEAGDGGSFTVFPNPSQGVFTIQMEEERLDSKQVQVFDVSGQSIPFHIVSETREEATLTLDRAVDGIYFVRVGNQASRILVRQR